MPKKRRHPSALIIIDVQNDFCPGGSLAVPGGDEIVPIINRVSSEFFRVVATRDWHPEGHVSFATSHPGKRPFDTIPVGTEPQVLWPDHCIQGSHGAEFHTELDIRPVDLILHKGTSPTLDSYSAFFENDHSTPTGLEPYLRGFACEELYFCGLATDVCVRASVLDAVRLGFRCILITDAVRGVGAREGSTEAAVEEMIGAGVVARASTELA